MAALPYMQLEIAKYLADTTHLATVEHGAYMLLIMNYWQRGGALKNSDARLAAICRLTVEEFLRHKDVLSEFFEVTEDEWVHHRIEGDLDSARKRVEGARTAGTASGRKRNGKPTENERTFNGRSTDVQPEANGRSESVERNGNQDKRKEEKTKEENLPVLSVELGSVKFDHGMVSQGVLMELGLSGTHLARNLSDVAKAEIARGADGLALMGQMAESGRQYLKAKGDARLSYPVGLEKFYGEGLWRDPKLWPWKDGYKPPSRAAPDPLEEQRRERQEALNEKRRLEGNGSEPA